MLSDYFLYAFVNLGQKKLRSWLTLLGIFIGIAAVVALIGLGEGLKLAVNSQFGVSTVSVLTIQAGGVAAAGPPGTGVVNPLTSDDVENIERLSTIDSAITRIIESGQLEFDDRVVFGSAINIPEGEDRDFAYETLDLSTEEGRLLKDGDTGRVMLGYNFFADNVGLDKAVRVGNTVTIQGRDFDVIGITAKKGSFIFDNVVYMEEEDLVDLFDTGENVDAIVATVKDTDKMDQAKEQVERELRKIRDVKIGEEDFNVQTPEAALSSLNSVLGGVQIFIVLIAAVSVLVGALGIVNTMLTSVLERRRDIGIMKSIGAKNSDIFVLFFFESGLLGLMGGIIGVILGSIISFYGIISLNTFLGAATEPAINIGLILGALFGSFVIGSLAGIVPALKAARENPVDALRG